MCSIVIRRDPDADWPVLIAANRDEMRDRPWDAPARHWPDRPDIVAGLDRLAGGSWLGLNDTADAARAFATIDTASYRPFNMLIADDRDAFWFKSMGTGRVAVEALPVGVSMITADDRNDPASPRIAFNLPRFEASADDWPAWERLLASREGPAEKSYMRVDLPSGFGTSSHSLIALPTTRREHSLKPLWRFAAASGDSPAFEPVKLR